MRLSANSKKKFTPKELDANKGLELGLTDEWRDFAGKAERNGVWLIWGRSFSGKTAFCVRLAKHIASIGWRVVYLSLEDGAGESMRLAFKRECATTVSTRLSLWRDMRLEELIEELKKQRSPQVIIVDSLQYLGINQAGYKKLRSMFPNKLFIFISHANERKEPIGSCANFVRFDAGVKIVVDGFVAYANSRFGGGKPIVIWKEGAERNTIKNKEKLNLKQEEYNEHNSREECEKDAEAIAEGYMEKESDSSDWQIPGDDDGREVYEWD